MRPPWPAYPSLPGHQTIGVQHRADVHQGQRLQQRRRRHRRHHRHRRHADAASGHGDQDRRQRLRRPVRHQPDHHHPLGSRRLRRARCRWAAPATSSATTRRSTRLQEHQLLRHRPVLGQRRKPGRHQAQRRRLPEQRLHQRRRRLHRHASNNDYDPNGYFYTLTLTEPVNNLVIQAFDPALIDVGDNCDLAAATAADGRRPCQPRETVVTQPVDPLCRRVEQRVLHRRHPLRRHRPGAAPSSRSARPAATRGIRRRTRSPPTRPASRRPSRLQRRPSKALDKNQRQPSTRRSPRTSANGCRCAR